MPERKHCWSDVPERLTHKWSHHRGENAKTVGSDVRHSELEEIPIASLSLGRSSAGSEQAGRNWRFEETKEGIKWSSRRMGGRLNWACLYDCQAVLRAHLMLEVIKIKQWLSAWGSFPSKGTFSNV